MGGEEEEVIKGYSENIRDIGIGSEDSGKGK
jgi:hypothetical protein